MAKKIEMDAMIVELKVRLSPEQYKTFMVDLDKVDTTWLVRCLDYGVRRFINDSHSTAKGKDKADAIEALIKDMESGEAMPEKVRTSNSTPSDPILALALKNAKAALTTLFKTVTGFNKALDFATHEKVAPFFTVTEDRAIWKDETVKAWMAKQAENGGIDYMADAKATIDSVKDDDIGDALDF